MARRFLASGCVRRVPVRAQTRALARPIKTRGEIWLPCVAAGRRGTGWHPPAVAAPLHWNAGAYLRGGLGRSPARAEGAHRPWPASVHHTHLPPRTPSARASRHQTAEELHKIVLDHEMRFAVTLILANKSDLPHALPKDEIAAEVLRQTAPPLARLWAALRGVLPSLPSAVPTLPTVLSDTDNTACDTVAAGTAGRSHVPHTADVCYEWRGHLGGHDVAR